MSITDELREWAEDNTLKDRVLTTYPPQHAVHGVLEALLRIADRIDAEHQKALDEWKAEHGQMWLKGYAECHAELLEGNETLASDLEGCGWIRLPKDADGEPIHVGDKVTCARSVWEVTGLRLTGLAWGVCCTIFNDHGGSGTNVYPPCDLRHYHKPTVEDVLRQVIACANNGTHVHGALDTEQIVAEYAAKLRLAEGEDA